MNFTEKLVHFPEDLNKNRSIIFSFYKDDSLSNTAKAMEGLVTTGAQALTNLNAKSAEKALNAGGEVINSAGSLLKKVGSEVNKRIKTGKLSTKEKKFNKKEWIFQIGLPIPNTLGEGNTHEWNTESGLVSQVLNTGAGPDTVVGKAANGIAALMGSRNITVNPDYVQMYRGTTPREMTLSWSLVPNNREEADRILAIGRRFKAYSSGVKTSTGSFLIAPPFCSLEIQNESLNESLRLNNMVIKNVSINYSESQMEMFHDGVPKEIIISVTLAERTVRAGDDWLIKDEKDYYKKQMDIK